MPCSRFTNRQHGGRRAMDPSDSNPEVDKREEAGVQVHRIENYIVNINLPTLGSKITRLDKYISLFKDNMDDKQVNLADSQGSISAASNETPSIDWSENEERKLVRRYLHTTQTSNILRYS